MLQSRRYKMDVIVEADLTTTVLVPACNIIANHAKAEVAQQYVKNQLQQLANQVRDGQRKLPKSDAIPGAQMLTFELLDDPVRARR